MYMGGHFNPLLCFNCRHLGHPPNPDLFCTFLTVLSRATKRSDNPVVSGRGPRSVVTSIALSSSPPPRAPPLSPPPPPPPPPRPPPPPPRAHSLSMRLRPVQPSHRDWTPLLVNLQRDRLSENLDNSPGQCPALFLE